MAQTSYFASRPDIVKIFDDLEAYRNYCVFEMIEFNEAALYNRQDRNWQAYEASKRPRRPRGEYNRSGAARSGAARNFTR